MQDMIKAIEAEPVHYVDWCSIFAGAVMAAAVSAVLFTFGTAVGLSMVSPYTGEGVSGVAYIATLGLWTIWVVVSSFMAGGYIAGRMRRRIGDATEHEVEVRDGIHGGIVWATGIVIASLLLTMGVSGVLGAATKAGGAAAAVSANSPDARANFTLDSLFRAPPKPAVQVSSTEGASASMAPAGTNPTTAGDVGRERAEVGRLLVFGMKDGALSAENKTYVASLVANRTGMSQAEAEQRVNQVIADTKAAADKARKAALIIGFITAATLLIAAASAAWASTLGGRHRDQGTDHSAFWRWPA